jgi:hypothetical protein
LTALIPVFIREISPISGKKITHRWTEKPENVFKPTAWSFALIHPHFFSDLTGDGGGSGILYFD